jgi:predicted nucleic-acid-binding Zn-ribbon protein
MAVQISQDDFVAFFEAKKTGTYKCPVCSHENFRLNGVVTPPPGSPMWPMGLMTLQVSDVLPGPAVAQHTFLSFSCSNCGRADFFHIRQFEQWMEEQGKKIEEPDG